jgi:hypothetical protein
MARTSVRAAAATPAAAAAPDTFAQEEQTIDTEIRLRRELAAKLQPPCFVW